MRPRTRNEMIKDAEARVFSAVNNLLSITAPEDWADTNKLAEREIRQHDTTSDAWYALIDDTKQERAKPAIFKVAQAVLVRNGYHDGPPFPSLRQTRQPGTQRSAADRRAGLRSLQHEKSYTSADPRSTKGGKMNDLEMCLGKEIAEVLERKNMVVFRNNNTKQPYVLIKLKDELGAVTEISGGLYMVIAKDYKPKKGGRKMSEEDWQELRNLVNNGNKYWTDEDKG